MRLLLGVALAAVASCAPASPEAGEHQRTIAEREALIEAMKQHPALQPGNNSDAKGKPISVPTTVPRRPADAAEADNHHHP